METVLMPTESVLVAFFSHSGNTRVIANQIHETVGGDVFRIVTVDPYPGDYNAVVDSAGREQKSNSRPALAEQVANMDPYDVVFVGYPIWWSTMPMAVFSFLEKHDFRGKKIVPFCTHEGSAWGRSIKDIGKICPEAVVLDGLAVRGGNVRTAKKEVQAWLERIGSARK
jgi:flavodoxin